MDEHDRENQMFQMWLLSFQFFLIYSRSFMTSLSVSTTYPLSSVFSCTSSILKFSMYRKPQHFRVFFSAQGMRSTQFKKGPTGRQVSFKGKLIESRRMVESQKCTTERDENSLNAHDSPNGCNEGDECVTHESITELSNAHHSPQ